MQNESREYVDPWIASAVRCLMHTTKASQEEVIREHDWETLARIIAQDMSEMNSDDMEEANRVTCQVYTRAQQDHDLPQLAHSTALPVLREETGPAGALRRIRELLNREDQSQAASLVAAIQRIVRK